MSWIESPGGCHLFCNREEKRTRRLAHPPRLFESGGTRYIAPIDADSGGTWLAVNEYGIALCLLNGAGTPGFTGPSRGLIIPELIWARTTDDCAFLLRHLDPSTFAPFTLLMLEPGRPALAAEWNGARLALDTAARAPLTSSSFDSDAVRRERLAEFARRAPADPAAHYRFHASHAGSSGAHAPCMHRPDAETVSFSWVIITGREVRFLYLPAAPCRCEPAEQRVLARAA